MVSTVCTYDKYIQEKKKVFEKYISSFKKSFYFLITNCNVVDGPGTCTYVQLKRSITSKVHSVSQWEATPTPPFQSVMDPKLTMVATRKALTLRRYSGKRYKTKVHT